VTERKKALESTRRKATMENGVILGFERRMTSLGARGWMPAGRLC
jgi:hypothetical protein